MARRPPEDFRVDRPSMAQISRAPRLPLRSPCRAKYKCPAVVAGLLDCSAGPGKVSAACHGLAGVGRAHRRLDEGNPSLFVGAIKVWTTG